MRILQINKFFYRRGGAETVFFDTINGWRERGHEVVEFSMSHPRNLTSEFKAYFASQLPELLYEKKIIGQWKIFKRLFYSKEIANKLTALILATEPQVAHLHNVYHHLSAATFTTLFKNKIPTVLTLHDVFPLCPNHSLLNGQTIGDDVFKNKLYNCARYKCVNDQFWPSLAGTLEAYYYRYKKIWDKLNLFICPSEFMKNKMVEYGFPINKMRVIKNPFTVKEEVKSLGAAVVYLGRLHYEKGIREFMHAARELRNYPIIIAGTGPEEEWIDKYIEQYSLTQIKRVGWMDGKKKEQFLNSARVVVVPSLFYENCSLAILEALSCGRLVVATDRGGNSEIIIDGQTGFLSRAEDPQDLVRGIKQAMQLPAGEAEKMVNQGRELVKNNHNPEKYFSELEKVYSEIIKK